MKTIYFDDNLITRSGKCIPYYDSIQVKDARDNELVWFHTGYGRLREYRMIQVDSDNFIAQPTGNFKFKGE